MKLSDAIYGRRAVRNYTDEALPRATLMELIRAATQAPSAVNAQPWRFGVFEGRDRLEMWSVRAKAHFLSTLPPDADPIGLRKRLEDPALNIFYNARLLVVIYAERGGLHPSEDCCLAAQNFMLAAHGLGWATCPIGLARPWLDLPTVKSELKVPVDLEAVFPLIVGRPAGVTPPVPRNEPQVVVWL
jgi:nitroreductase